VCFHAIKKLVDLAKGKLTNENHSQALSKQKKLQSWMKKRKVLQGVFRVEGHKIQRDLLKFCNDFDLSSSTFPNSSTHYKQPHNFSTAHEQNNTKQFL
jgi:hypothetical protein